VNSKKEKSYRAKPKQTKPMQDLLIKNALNAIAKSRRELTEYLLVESNKRAYIDAALYYGYRLEEVNYPIDRV